MKIKNEFIQRVSVEYQRYEKDNVFSVMEKLNGYPIKSCPIGEDKYLLVYELGREEVDEKA